MMPATAKPVANRSSDVFGVIDVASDAPLFGEHFESFAVLPGSFSLTLSIAMLFDALGVECARSGRSVTLRKISFTQPVRPGERLTAHLLRLRQDGPGATAHFELRNAIHTSVMDGIVSWEHDA